MEMICPLCNGLKEIEEHCPSCQAFMNDTGPIENYYDDYSPYLDQNITQRLNDTDPENCIHLFQCSQCQRDKRIPIPKEVH